MYTMLGGQYENHCATVYDDLRLDRVEWIHGTKQYGDCVGEYYYDGRRHGQRHLFVINVVIVVALDEPMLLL